MTPGGSPDEAGSSSSRPIDPSPSSLTGLQHLISATRQLGQPVVHRLSNASSRPTAPTSKRPSGDARASLSPPPPDRLGSPSISLNGSSLHPVTELVAQEEGHATVRTVPSWVHTYEYDDPSSTTSDTALLAPDPAQVAQHNHTPAAKLKADPARGRLYDAQRDRDPITPHESDRESASRWRTFVNISALPVDPTKKRQVVDEKWLEENMPNLDRPWLAGHEEGQQSDGAEIIKRRKKGTMEKFERILIRHHLVPLWIRVTIFVFSMCALALGASIFAESKRDRVPQRSSTLIAIIFDAVALIYLVWITVDEYIGKPLGLRSPAAKLRLILLDLFFIVFNSANLSLAFDALYDNRWECREDEPDRSGPHNVNLCDRQRALSGVLLIALVAWLLTFSVSVLRVVARAAGDE